MAHKSVLMGREPREAEKDGSGVAHKFIGCGSSWFDTARRGAAGHIITLDLNWSEK